MSVRILLALAAAAPVAAQGRVITVDAQNRPGTDYTTIAAAVAASVDGDRLRVRDGTYDVFRVDSKAISIVGEPGAVVRYDLNVGVEIRGLAAGRECSIAGLDFGNWTSVAPAVTVDACAGRVLLERLWGRTMNNFAFGSAIERPVVRIEGSNQVAVDDCRLNGYPPILVRDSTLLAADSECVGGDGFSGHGSHEAGAAVHAERSRVVLSRCVLRGGNVPLINFGNAQPALMGTTVDWTVHGVVGNTIEAGVNFTSGAPQTAVGGTGTLVIDPRVAILPSNGGPPVGPGVTRTDRAMPSLHVSGAPIGGTVTLNLASTAGDLFGITLGVSGDAVSLGPLGTLWHDPLGPYLVVAVGVLPANGNYNAFFPVPRDDNLVGRRFVWQALAGMPGGLLLSNPASYVH